MKNEVEIIQSESDHHAVLGFPSDRDAKVARHGAHGHIGDMFDRAWSGSVR